MSRPQDPHRPFFSFGNPLRMMIPKGSSLSPNLLSILNSFEEKLAKRLHNLMPKTKEDVLTFSWMGSAMNSLCEIHTDVKGLITTLDLPVSDWDEKWVDVYLDNSVKLLDISTAFTSELSRLNQCHLLIQYAIRNLDSAPSDQFDRARSSLDRWRKQVNSKNPRLENCFSILETLCDSLDLPKVKNSSRGKVLMRALYGVRVVTLFVCSVFASIVSGHANKLMDLKVSQTHLWADSFDDLRGFVNGEVRNRCLSKRVMILKELHGVDASVEKLYGVCLAEESKLKKCVLDLKSDSEELSKGLDLLGNSVDRFFNVVLSGRDALMSNLRVDNDVFGTMKKKKNVEAQIVR